MSEIKIGYESKQRLVAQTQQAQAVEAARFIGLAGAALRPVAQRIRNYFSAMLDVFSRAAYYRDLSGLSDWELADRGIKRGDIKYFVESCFQEPATAANDRLDRSELAA